MVGDVQLAPKAGKGLDGVEGEVTIVMVFRDIVRVDYYHKLVEVVVVFERKVNLNGDADYTSVPMLMITPK